MRAVRIILQYQAARGDQLKLRRGSRFVASIQESSPLYNGLSAVGRPSASARRSLEILAEAGAAFRQLAGQVWVRHSGYQTGRMGFFCCRWEVFLL